MIEVVFLRVTDDRWERKGNCAYFFRNTNTNQLYKWSTSKNNHYGILENNKYFLDFVETEEIEDGAIRIKNTKIYEKLMNGTIRQRTNKRGSYKEWM